MWAGKYGAGMIAVSPRPHRRQAHVAEAFLRADRDDHLALGIEPHAELLEILGGDLAAKVQNAVRLAVAVIVRIAGGLHQLLDDDVLRRLAGVSHTEVDHVLPPLPLLVQKGVHPRQHILRQAVDPLG
jgi:hypothetical protein